MQRWSKMENLEDEEDHGCPSAIDNDELKVLVEADPYNDSRTYCKVRRKSCNKKLGKLKKLDKRVSHELNESQKLHRYEVCSALLLHNNNDPILDRINMQWKMDFIRQSAAISTVVGSRRSSTTLPKIETALKEDHGSDGVVDRQPVWSTTTSWIQAKPLRQRSIVKKSTKCTSCNAWHWSIEKGPLFFTTMPGHTSYNQRCRNWMI